MMPMNSPVGIKYRLYKYRFWGLPKGVSMPPRLAAMFCKINTVATSSFLPAVEKTKYPRGRKVISAISLAMSMEPMKVI